MTDLSQELATAAEQLRSARAVLAASTNAAKGVARKAIEAGMSEVVTARSLGIDRVTLRRWLGK